MVSVEEGEGSWVGADGACPRSGASPPVGDAEVATMSATTSATTGRRYGLERVCRTWERSRSALYARLVVTEAWKARTVARASATAP